MTVKSITLIPSCPTPTVKVNGGVCVSVAVYPGGASMTLAQFTVLANAYNAALQSFLTNEAAHTALGAGKEFIYAQGSPEAPQGIKGITYAP